VSDEARSSRTARAAQLIGVAAPVLTLGGIGLSQLGMPAMVGFRLFTLAILLGLVALLVGIVGLFLTRGGVGGRNHALTGIALGVAMLAVVAVRVVAGGSAPPINDITTNLEDPPGYAARTGDHPNADRDMAYPGDWIAIVREAYPDLAPIRLQASPPDAFARTLSRAEALGWTVVEQDPAAGTFEAEDATALFRFVDDISVRVRPDAAGSVVDVRSKSRDGRGDIGANAARIREFRHGLSD